MGEYDLFFGLLYLREIAERSEAKRRKRSFLSKYHFLDIFDVLASLR